MYICVCKKQYELNSLFEISANKLVEPLSAFRRSMFGQLPLDQRMVALKGARGTGKTTLMLQYMQSLQFESNKVLFISMDDIYFSQNRLLDLADYFYKRGGKVLLIDEVHKYPGWSVELKNIYDRYPLLQVVFTSSSALAIHKGEADLSRRAVIMELKELSFREYLDLEYQMKMDPVNLDNLLDNHLQISAQVCQKMRPLEKFDDYLRFGAYPFVREGKAYFLKKLAATVNQVLENDLPAIDHISYATVVRLKKLLFILAETCPFKPNISTLAQQLETTRDKVLRYLNQLERADLLLALRSQKSGDSYLTKPEKIYLHNPSLMYAINQRDINEGTVRETFFLSQVSASYPVYFTPDGDFMVNNTIFEVGGKNKTRKQVSHIPDARIVKDDIEFGSGNTIPLWMFGLMY